MPEVACYCGGLFSFERTAAPCPRCGALATIPTADTEPEEDGSSRQMAGGETTLMPGSMIRPYRIRETDLLTR